MMAVYTYQPTETKYKQAYSRYSELFVCTRGWGYGDRTATTSLQSQSNEGSHGHYIAAQQTLAGDRPLISLPRPQKISTSE